MIKKVIKKASTIILVLALVLSNITVTNVYASDYDQLYLEEARRKVQDAVNIYMAVSNATTKAEVQKVIDDELQKQSGLMEATFTGEWKTELVFTPAEMFKPGLIKGVITITLNNDSSKTIDAKINRSIEALPMTDEYKVGNVKARVDGYFKSFVGKNTDTKDSIMSSIKADSSLLVYSATASWKAGSPTITPATKEKAGSIIGTIVLTCGSATAEVSVDKVIDKLPKTDKEKIDEAKPLAESAITAIIATNSTTAGNILDAATNGIASVNGVTASWKAGSPTITPATKEKAGSITGTIVLTCGSETVEIAVNKVIEKLPVPTPEKPTITVGNSGANHQLNNGKDMTFTCTGKLEDLTGVYVDGNLVDESNYTLKSGSTILTLKASYLDTLSAGKHTLKFQYKDNISAETNFTITAKAGETPKPSSPQTGDSSNLVIYAFLLLLSGCAVGAVTYKRKKSINN